jgi:allantoate deiminase
MDNLSQLAATVVRLCREIAECSEEKGRITRTFLSTPMRDVHRILGDWMQRVGMIVEIDAAGNLRGVWNAPVSRRLAIGSHLDTVPDAGAFDGVLGVVMGIALVEAGSPKLCVEVIGFSEEEGVRYKLPFIGSRAVVGILDDMAIGTISGALREFGLDPSELLKARLHADTAAYLEFHIEQGPVLESLGLAVGVVDAIAGQSRLTLQFTGKANHAGTTPMILRRDAMAACAEWVLEVERFAAEESRLVATVGRVEVIPNASNVIPGVVKASLDVRSACDSLRGAAVRHLLHAAEEIGTRRGLVVSFDAQFDQAAVELDADMRGKLACAVEAAGYTVHHLSSGAGHDAMILAPHVPTAMLFLRSPGGISHHPDEDVLIEDVEAALRVGLEFIAHV